jgi:hypothetical protein
VDRSRDPSANINLRIGVSSAHCVSEEILRPFRNRLARIGRRITPSRTTCRMSLLTYATWRSSGLRVKDRSFASESSGMSTVSAVDRGKLHSDGLAGEGLEFSDTGSTP